MFQAIEGLRQTAQLIVAKVSLRQLLQGAQLIR